MTQWGIPVKARGFIVDSKGKVVDSIVTSHDGMGSFSTSSGNRDHLFCEVEGRKGMERQHKLPAPKPAGIAMQGEN
jgi:hypothetical protein